jgi:hypothetical protein
VLKDWPGRLPSSVAAKHLALPVLCLLYQQLTGLWPFYDIEDDSVVQRKVLSGERALVPRHGNQSLSSLTTAAAMDVEMEHALMDTMQKGWIHKPNERIDIFEAVRLLKAAMIRASNGTSVSKVDT